MVLDLRALARPVVQAPMAGGPSTPELAAAVSSAGGLGFLAAGYLTAERLRDDVLATRALTDAPFGVNLFFPQPSAARPADLAAYATAITADAARLGVGPGPTRFDDDAWPAKLDVLLSLRPALASFTFGTPSSSEVERLHERGVLVVVTVTTVEEGSLALAAGADALCAQGPLAGGHRGTFSPTAPPSEQSLEDLIVALGRLTEVPVVATGGITISDDVSRVLGLGAAAAQVGTAFLRADEAGTRPAHRAALVSPDFPRTVVTRAFSGRYARGLANEFTRAHDADAPFGYPEVNQLTGPLRRAAAAAGDPHRLNLWAGPGHARARAVPAAAILDALT